MCLNFSSQKPLLKTTCIPVRRPILNCSTSISNFLCSVMPAPTTESEKIIDDLFKQFKAEQEASDSKQVLSPVYEGFFFNEVASLVFQREYKGYRS